MKMKMIGNGLALLLMISCAEAPVYTPGTTSATTTSKTQSATKGKPQADASNNDEDEQPDDEDALPIENPMPAVTPTPTPTPTPAPTPAPPPAVQAGVAATGRTLLMQSCVGACHSMAGNTIDAKTAAALQASGNNGIAAHTTARATHFTPPAAGAAPNNFSHILAYLMSIPTPVMGPNLQ